MRLLHWPLELRYCRAPSTSYWGLSPTLLLFTASTLRNRFAHYALRPYFGWLTACFFEDE